MKTPFEVAELARRAWNNSESTSEKLVHSLAMKHSKVLAEMTLIKGMEFMLADIQMVFFLQGYTTAIGDVEMGIVAPPDGVKPQ